MISFRIRGNEEFNEWVKKVAESVREVEQPIVTVDLEEYKQASSSISKLKVEVSKENTLKSREARKKS